MSSVIVCASEDIKAVILASVENSQLKDEIKTAIFNEIEALDGCEGNLPVDFADAKKATKGTGRKKRKQSGYNVFVGECMGDKNIKAFADAPAAMKQCAADWKKGGPPLKEQYDARAKAINSGTKPN